MRQEEGIWVGTGMDGLIRISQPSVILTLGLQAVIPTDYILEYARMECTKVMSI